MTDSDKILIILDNITLQADRGALLVPLEAVDTDALVRPVVPGEGSSGKHTAYSLAQIALARWEDRDLTLESVDAGMPIRIERGDDAWVCKQGLVIAWTEQDVEVIAHAGLDIRQLLKIAHRATTRWIRLDVH